MKTTDCPKICAGTSAPRVTTNPVLTYADLILDYLEMLGVEFIFGVPGGAIEPLYNALARRKRRERVNPVSVPGYHRLGRKLPRNPVTPIQAIVSRHESGAAFMADGYYRETGRLGVCCATTGPGATNLITGVASAYADRVPMLVITPQTALPNFGKRALQESSENAIDVVGMFRHCTCYNSMVTHPDQLEHKLVSAIINAFQAPKGPSHLSIPMDVLNMKLEQTSPSHDIGPLLRKPGNLDKQSLNALRQCVSDSRKIVLIIGGECGDASEVLQEFAERTGAQVITTPMGKSWFNPYHRQYRGIFGFAGHDTARDLLLADDIDLVILVGCSLSELETGGWDGEALLNHRLIHVDSTIENFTRSAMAQLHVYGQVESVFSYLLLSMWNDLPDPNQHNHHDRACCTHDVSGTVTLPASLLRQKSFAQDDTQTPINPGALMAALADQFAKDTRFLCDAGNSWAWMLHYLHVNSTGNFRIGMGFGAMTWAIGAAIGTALSCQDSPVVCVTGDGSYLMSGQELTVAVQHRLSVIFIVLNDRALGMVKHGQRMGGGEPIGFALPDIDFAAIARALGAEGLTIRSIGDLKKLDFVALCKMRCPILLDVYIDPEAVPPIGSRVKVLAKGRTVGAVA